MVYMVRYFYIEYTQVFMHLYTASANEKQSSAATVIRLPRLASSHNRPFHL